MGVTGEISGGFRGGMTSQSHVAVRYQCTTESERSHWTVSPRIAQLMAGEGGIDKVVFPVELSPWMQLQRIVALVSGSFGFQLTRYADII